MVVLVRVLVLAGHGKPGSVRFGVSQCLWGAMRTALKCNNNNHPPTHTASEKVRCWAVGLLDAAGSSSVDVTHQPAAEGASTRLGKPFIAIKAELFFLFSLFSLSRGTL